MTNTVVSAFLWGGPPTQLLESARAERITLFSSAALDPGATRPHSTGLER